MNNKGFILIDSLISIVVVSSICLLTIYIYKAELNYKDGYINYQKEIADEYESIYSKMGECEKCMIEEDLSQQDY